MLPHRNLVLKVTNPKLFSLPPSCPSLRAIHHSRSLSFILRKDPKSEITTGWADLSWVTFQDRILTSRTIRGARSIFGIEENWEQKDQQDRFSILLAAVRLITVWLSTSTSIVDVKKYRNGMLFARSTIVIIERINVLLQTGDNRNVNNSRNDNCKTIKRQIHSETSNSTRTTI